MTRKQEKAEASEARAKTMDRFAQVFQKLYEPVNSVEIAATCETEATCEIAGSVKNAGSGEIVASEIQVAAKTQLHDSGEIAGSCEKIATKMQVAAKTNVAANSQLLEYPETWFSVASKRVESSAAASILAHVCTVIPVGGGMLRTGAFARLVGIHPNGVRNALERLSECGVIECVRHGPDGRWIRVVCRDSGEKAGSCIFAGTCSGSSSLESKKQLLPESDSGEIAGSEENTGSYKNAASGKNAGRDGFAAIAERQKKTSALEGIFAATLAAGKAPEQLKGAIVASMLKRDPVETAALILEYAPKSKTNLCGYLSSVFESDERPSPEGKARAESVLECGRSMKLEIGRRILPGDWCRAARILGVRVDESDSERTRESILGRMRSFVEAYL